MFMRPWKNRTTVTLAAMVLLLGLGLVTRTLAANQPEPASAEAASALAAQEEIQKIAEGFDMSIREFYNSELFDNLDQED